MVKYCITHKNNLTFITQDDDCPKNSEVFYAIDPLFRPIPYNTVLYYAKTNPKSPYNIIDIKTVYDMYDIDALGIYFITYSRISPGTIPLFIYDKGTDGIYITTREQKNQKQLEISPIYVFPNELPKFKCYNGSLISENTNVDDIFFVPGFGTNLNAEIINKAIVDCNQLVPFNQGGGHPFNLIELIRATTGVTNHINNPEITMNSVDTKEGKKNYGIPIVLSIFVVLCIGLILAFVFRRSTV